MSGLSSCLESPLTLPYIASWSLSQCSPKGVCRCVFLAATAQPGTIVWQTAAGVQHRRWCSRERSNDTSLSSAGASCGHGDICHDLCETANRRRKSYYYLIGATYGFMTHEKSRAAETIVDENAGKKSEQLPSTDRKDTKTKTLQSVNGVYRQASSPNCKEGRFP